MAIRYGSEYNGIIYRTLEEQVLQNKADIAEHYNRDRVLADFGIKVLGSVPTESDLPETASEYGEAYIVGTEEPFDVFVWTREDPNIPGSTDRWLNIGPIAIEGPQGPEGPKGEKGPQGKPGADANDNNKTVIIIIAISTVCIIFTFAVVLYRGVGRRSWWCTR